MTDLEQRVRETLHRRAIDVQPKLEVPSGLIPRAGRRIARNVSGALVAVALVAVGAVTGVRALTGPDRQLPVNTPAGAPACMAEQLTGTSHLMAPMDAPTSREGFLVITNKSSAACSLRDRPTVSVLNDVGQPLDLRGGALDPFWKDAGAGQPPDWPVVTLQPGGAARVRVQWNSWCTEIIHADAWMWQVTVQPGSDPLQFALDEGQDIPTCGNGQPAPKVKVGPFEPYSG